MRFQLVSLLQVSQRSDPPFTLWPLTDIDEYRCYLYRCEGKMPLHRHVDHDELLWPQDRAMELLHRNGKLMIPAGHIVHVPRDWKHASTASHSVYVMMISRGERSLSMNGHYENLVTVPPITVDPMVALADVGPNTPRPFLRCDTLQLYVERVVGNGPGRRAIGDQLIVPIERSIGLRCGGVVVVAAEREIARVPAGCTWNLFGDGVVVWMQVERRGEEGAVQDD